VTDFGEVVRASVTGLAAALPEIVRDVAEDLLSESRDEVPIDQMDLSNSGKVTVAGSAPVVEGAVSYDTPYAVIQHEAEEFRHQDGRKARYLADPHRANADRYLKYIASRGGQAMGG
jgi:hypothetical protein